MSSFLPPLPPDLFLPPPSPPPPPPPTDNILAVRLIMASALSFFAVLLCLCSCFNGYRKSQARAAAIAADERNGELQLHATGGAATNTAARLPAFKYSRTVKHNVTGGGEEAAATCSVCLGAFQLGEKVRLLPACLHLYHAECIDLWLDAHSTCPICRSDTDPAVGVGRVPPV